MLVGHRKGGCVLPNTIIPALLTDVCVQRGPVN
jgi:hypothetical protein